MSMGIAMHSSRELLILSHTPLEWRNHTANSGSSVLCVACLKVEEEGERASSTQLRSVIHSDAEVRSHVILRRHHHDGSLCR